MSAPVEPVRWMRSAWKPSLSGSSFTAVGRPPGSHPGAPRNASIGEGWTWQVQVLALAAGAVTLSSAENLAAYWGGIALLTGGLVPLGALATRQRSALSA